MSSRTYVRASRHLEVHEDDERNYALSFDDVLPDGVTISSVNSATVYLVPAVDAGDLDTDDVSTDLTVSGEQPNASSYTDDDGDTVPAGRAVRFDLVADAGSAGSDYLVDFQVTTSSGKKVAGGVEVRVRR